MPYEESGMSIGMKAILVLVVVIAVVFVMLLGIFRIDTGKGAIITHLGGNRDATTAVGWHWIIPGFESYNIYPVVNDYIYFPSTTTSINAGGVASGVSGVEINAKDDTVVDVSAITYFDRTDLYQWGVKNVDPDTQFDRAVAGIIRDVIQTSDAKDILHARDSVAVEIFNKLKSSGIESQYGVSITKFQIQHSSYIDEVVQANAHKQALGLEAEGRLDAATKDAEAIKIKATAEAFNAELLKQYSPAVLQFMQNMELYNTMRSRTGDTVWVVPAGMSTNPVFTPTSTNTT